MNLLRSADFVNFKMKSEILLLAPTMEVQQDLFLWRKVSLFWRDPFCSAMIMGKKSKQFQIQDVCFDCQCSFHVAGVKFPNLLHLPDRNLIRLFVSTCAISCSIGFKEAYCWGKLEVRIFQTFLRNTLAFHMNCHPNRLAVVRFEARHFVGWKVTAQHCSSHHQDYFILSRRSRTKSSFATGILLESWEGEQPPSIYIYDIIFKYIYIYYKCVYCI